MPKSYRNERFRKAERSSSRHYGDESSDRRRHSAQVKEDLSVSGGKRHRDRDYGAENRNENRQNRSDKGDWKGFSRSNKRAKYSSNSKYDIDKQDKLYPDDPDNDNHRNEPKSREEVLKEQKKDQKEFQKNRRMFGFVAGLLEKFEESNNNRQNFDMRQEIEAKIEQREEKERRAQIEERAKKAEEKHMRQQLKRLQADRNDKITQFECWEKSQKNFDNCILTRAKPPIYYTPREHNKRTKERLEDTKSLNRLKIAEQRVKHQKTIDELDNRIAECKLACGSSLNSEHNDDDDGGSVKNSNNHHGDNHHDKNDNISEGHHHRTRQNSRSTEYRNNDDTSSATAAAADDEDIAKNNNNHNNNIKHEHRTSHRSDSKKDESNTDRKNVIVKRDFSINFQSKDAEKSSNEDVRKKDLSFNKDSTKLSKKKDTQHEHEEGEISERDSDYDL